MSKEEVEIVRRHFELSLAGDREGFKNFAVADNITYFDNTFGVRVDGKEEFCRAIDAFWESFPDMKCHELQFIDADEARTVIVFATFSGTDSGPGYQGMQATGKKQSRRYCMTFKVNDDEKIVEVENYYDALGIMIQLGHVELPEVEARMALQTPAPVGVDYSDLH